MVKVFKEKNTEKDEQVVNCSLKIEAHNFTPQCKYTQENPNTNCLFVVYRVFCYCRITNLKLHGKHLKHQIEEADHKNVAIRIKKNSQNSVLYVHVLSAK